MCGICGFVNIDGRPIDQIALERMTQSLKHRGPDDFGYFVKNNVALGHRRLSIIDLSQNGRQPMCNEDRTIWIIYNGEVYNFLELRQTLEAKGHTFKSNTDTEVILHLYEEKGTYCINDLNGMFAFAIFDANKNRLFLARDRFGIKPLHYAMFDNTFIFASEIKSLLLHPSVTKRIDPFSLAQYLTFEYVPCPKTIFSGIKKLRPGHFIIFEKNQIREKKYWELNYQGLRSKFSFSDEMEVVEKLTDMLRDSVKRRLVSDVPLGVFLSGGIDSSMIVALMKELSNSEVKTFSITFDDKSFDESRFSRKIAKFLGTEHYEQKFSPQDMLNIIPKLMDFMDEPCGDASFIPTFLLSRFTREKVKVSLSGDGGDEVFAGYQTYQAHKLAAHFLKFPEWIRKEILEKIILNLPVSTANISLDFQLKKFISGIDFPEEIRNYIWLGSFKIEELKGLLKKDVFSSISTEEIFSVIYDCLSNYSGKEGIEKILYLDRRFFLQDDMLVKIDRTSMANSLESREPMLDHKLVEFVASLPQDLKLKNFTTKYIFKKAASRFLPREIVHRKKKGFGIPVANWIKKELKDLVLDIFSEDSIRSQGLFNYKYIQGLLTEHFAGKRDNRKQLWTLLIFELWYERYIS